MMELHRFFLHSVMCLEDNDLGTKRHDMEPFHLALPQIQTLIIPLLVLREILDTELIGILV
jgi:hypothetical protein